MNRTIIKIDDVKWKSLGTKSFSKLMLSHGHASTARVIHLAGLPKFYANTTTAISSDPGRGVALLQNISVPAGVTLCLEGMSVANISSTIGNVNTDNFELMVKCDTASPDIDILLES